MAEVPSSNLGGPTKYKSPMLSAQHGAFLCDLLKVGNAEAATDIKVSRLRHLPIF
jgi:hypothetical protein